MDRIRCPTRPGSLLDSFLSTSRSTDELNSIQDDSRAEFIPKRKFQLRQICQNLAQKIRILKIGDMLRNVATRHGDVPCYWCDDDDGRFSAPNKTLRISYCEKIVFFFKVVLRIKVFNESYTSGAFMCLTVSIVISKLFAFHCIIPCL
jgi:hypothetical protein